MRKVSIHGKKTGEPLPTTITTANLGMTDVPEPPDGDKDMDKDKDKDKDKDTTEGQGAGGDGGPANGRGGRRIKQRHTKATAPPPVAAVGMRALQMPPGGAYLFSTAPPDVRDRALRRARLLGLLLPDVQQRIETLTRMLRDGGATTVAEAEYQARHVRDDVEVLLGEPTAAGAVVTRRLQDNASEVMRFREWYRLSAVERDNLRALGEAHSTAATDAFGPSNLAVHDVAAVLARGHALRENLAARLTAEVRRLLAFAKRTEVRAKAKAAGSDFRLEAHVDIPTGAALTCDAATQFTLATLEQPGALIDRQGRLLAILA